MKSNQNYFYLYWKILGLTIVFFILLELILSIHGPHISWRFEMLIAEILIVIITSILITTTIAYMYPRLRKAFIKKILKEYPGAQLMNDQNSILLLHNDEIKVILTINTGIYQTSFLTINYKGKDSEKIKILKSRYKLLQSPDNGIVKVGTELIGFDLKKLDDEINNRLKFIL